MHRHRQTTFVYAVGLSIQRLDKLGINHADQVIQRLVRVRDAAEQRDFALAQFLQMQLVRHGQLGNGRQIERGKAHTHADEDGFCGLASRLFENAVLLAGNAVGFTHFQALEQDVQRGLVVVIVLVDFSSGDHFHHHREVLFFGRSLVQQVQHKGLQQGGFGFFPEGVAAF